MVNIKETTEEARQAFDEIINLLTALPATKLNEIPFEGSWTAGQLGQHIILSAGGFVEVINGPTSETKRDPEEKVQAIRGMFLDFSIKMKSPESIVPEEKQYQLIALLEKLLDIKEKFLASIKTLDLSKTCTSFEIPQMGYITRAEAVHFTIVHLLRHNHQLKGIISKL